MKRTTLTLLACLMFFGTFGSYAQTNALGRSEAELRTQRQLDLVLAAIRDKRNARENSNPFKDPAIVQTLSTLRSSQDNPDAATTAALALAWIEFNDVQDDHHNKRARLTEVREKLTAIEQSASNQWQGKLAALGRLSALLFEGRFSEVEQRIGELEPLKDLVHEKADPILLRFLRAFNDKLPDFEYETLRLKAMSLAYQQKFEQAVSELKAYLALRPQSAERKQVEWEIQQLSQKQLPWMIEVVK